MAMRIKITPKEARSFHIRPNFGGIELKNRGVRFGFSCEENKPIQICATGSTVNDILNMAVIAACKIG